MLPKNWFEVNSQAVATFYPQFQRVEPPSEFGASLAWEGVISPLGDSAELGLILDDLATGRAVLSQGGRLLHDPSCSAVHSGIPFSLATASTNFLFRVVA